MTPIHDGQAPRLARRMTRPSAPISSSRTARRGWSNCADSSHSLLPPASAHAHRSLARRRAWRIRHWRISLSWTFIHGCGGPYRFRTILPALYTGRTRHYHVKVQAPQQGVLTTQLYFPDEPMNRRDGLFRRELMMRMAEAGDDLSARFDFVLDAR